MSDHIESEIVSLDQKALRDFTYSLLIAAAKEIQDKPEPDSASPEKAR